MNAKEILMRAVKCDCEGRILEAQDLYEEGKKEILQLLAHETDEHKKRVVCERIKEYNDRAEQIKDRVQKHVIGGKLVAHMPIDENSEGHSYKSVFGKYLDTEVKEVLIHEPHLYGNHQVRGYYKIYVKMLTKLVKFHNFISFLELLVKSCPCFKYVRLVTKTCNKEPEKQMDALEQIKTDLAKRNVTLRTYFDNTLHDRKIVLSNGYIIKIGLGLNIFKPLNPLFSLGLRDYDFRKCKQTDVDIWRTINVIC